MRRFVVKEKCLLFDFLREKMAAESREKVKRVLSRGVLVSGKIVTRHDWILEPGMIVEFDGGGNGVESIKARFKAEGLEIVYEDRWLIVVDKCSGLLSVGVGEGMRGVDSVITRLNAYFKTSRQRCNAHIVHRLDRDTSGLMMVAKSKDVARKLEFDWKGVVYERAYVAIVWGRMAHDEGTIRSWLKEGEWCMLSSKTPGDGKEAVTHYKVLKCTRKYTMLELHLDTGRRNQIRVQMREEGHPVVHDAMYGYKDDASPIDRLALHAERLCFRHPVTGEDKRFQSVVPEKMLRLVQ